MIDISRKWSISFQRLKVIKYKREAYDLPIAFVGRFSMRHAVVINQKACSSANLLFVFFHFRGFAFVQFKDPKQANAVKFLFPKFS